MAGYWEVVIPETTTNLCTNPSFEVDATGWGGGGTNVLTRSPTYSWRGGYSVEINYTDTADPMASFTVTLPTATTTYTINCWLYVPDNWDGGNISIHESNYAGSTLTENTIYTDGTTSKDTWVKLKSTLIVGADVAGTIDIKTTSAPTVGRDIYIDAFQIEELAYETTYCDGDQAGCDWTAAEHDSTSVRAAQSRAGGRVYNLADDLSVVVENFQGTGMLSSKHRSQRQAFVPGGVFLGRQTMPRVIDLKTNIKGSSRANLHSLRQTFIDAIKPDKVRGDQEILFRYTGANSDKPLEIAAVYDSGLEYFGRGQDEFTDYPPLRFIAYDPYFYELPEVTTHLTTSSTVTAADYIIGKVDGAWSALSSAFNSNVQSIVYDRDDGVLFAGGLFATGGGAPGDYIAKYTGGAWSAVGAGMDGNVRALALAPDGDLYLGGAFTDISGGGGGTYSYIARWDGAAYNAVGAGMNEKVYAIAIGTDGKVYVGGNFTDILGGPGGTYNRIAYWDGAAWNAMGTGLSSICWGLEVAPNGDVYAAGSFANAGGVAVNGIAKWNGTAWSALSTGLTGGAATSYAVEMDNKGRLYVSGGFTAAGGTSAANIAMWNGAAWFALGDGLNSTAFSLVYQNKTGLLYAGGAFSQAGDITLASRAAIWNGSDWVHLDVDLPGTPVVYTIELVEYNDIDDIYFGSDTAGNATGSTLATVTNNGKSSAYPKIIIERSGGTSATVEWLKNEDTGDTLWFDYALQDGERLTVDLTPGAVRVMSSYYGNVLRGILRGSDIASWRLLPGDNRITTYVLQVGAPTMIQYLIHRNTYESADGVA